MNQVRQGFLKRFLAVLIDGVVIVAAGMVIGLVLRGAPRMASMVSSLFALGFMSLEIVKAQSVGKMVMKIKITNPDGSDAPQDALIKRFAIKNAGSLIGLVAAFVPLLHIVGIIAGLAVLVGCFLVFRADKLALHDILAGTAVFGPETAGAGFPVTSAVATSNPQSQP